ncbi:MAG: hypothetical protein KatS3mg105_0488 [Gemmatales bacterium]|nr:MAG: hypothetical protein KatS3mg105_0488 [Gemmatales bacterium]
MSQTQALVEKVAALRNPRDPGGELPDNRDARYRQLEKHVSMGMQHHMLLERSLRQFSEPNGEIQSPSRLTARARRLLESTRQLLADLRRLADHLGELSLEATDPLQESYHDAVAMTEVILRVVQAFPDNLAEQLKLCRGLERFQFAAQSHCARLQKAVQNRLHDHRALCVLTETFTALAEEGEVDTQKWITLAEHLLNEAQQGEPLRLLQPTCESAVEQIVVHSLNCARVMARLVRCDPEWQDRILDPILAALLHDVGMMAVPPEVVLQSEKLSDDSRRALESHPQVGAEWLRKQFDRADWLAETALSHHEDLDGTGYPGGLRELQIPPLVRLVAVCDVYSAYCSKRAYRPPLNPRAALTETLLQAEEGKLDQGCAEKLLQLAFYPTGTVVELDDGSIGLVVGNHMGRRDLNTPTAPVVALFADSSHHAEPLIRHVDLNECDGRSIVRALDEDEISRLSRCFSDALR